MQEYLRSLLLVACIAVLAPLYEAIFEYPLQGATHTHAPLTLTLFPHSIYTCISVRCWHVASTKAGTLPYGLAVSPAPSVCGTWWKLNK